MRKIKVWLAALATLATCAGGVLPAHAQGSFYHVSQADLNGKPGTLIRAEKLQDPPAGAVAYRVLYRSTGLAGEPIAVSGIVMAPAGPPPAAGRPVIAWAHPTTGVVPACAPSLRPTPWRSIQGHLEMIARGFVVVATDYPGLGAGTVHPYLVGVSEARAVLDSVRAAEQMDGIGASRYFAVWGHSQGGHAALYTGILAASYAPDLHITSIAAAAPATELATLMEDDINSATGKILTAMTLFSWGHVYDAPVSKVVQPQMQAEVRRVGEMCGGTVLGAIELELAERGIQGGFLTVNDLPQVEPWRELTARNTPGPTPRGVPVFIAQGTADPVVRPAVTQAYMAMLCKAGVHVTFMPLPGVTHTFAGEKSAEAAVNWMVDRVNGVAQRNDCAG